MRLAAMALLLGSAVSAEAGLQSGLSYPMMRGLSVATIGALEPANPVVARERRMHRQG